MYFVSDREGTVIKEHSLLDSLLKVLYSHTPGRMLLKPLVCPAVSKIGGKLLDSRASAVFIRPFVRWNHIAMGDFENRRYASYNAFFKRKLKPGVRTVNPLKDALISPCDGRLTVYKMDEACSFSIKQSRYTAESLLRDKKLAQKYAGGYVWIFRLGVDDYHHYIYIDDGRVSGIRRIKGVLHTVKPAAFENIPVYKENAREYCLLRSANFGTVLLMEVGALFVGKIENQPGKKTVCRGWEKGNFAFGGSTIILMTEKGQAVPAGDILRNSRQGIEVKVKLGEQVGRKLKKTQTGLGNKAWTNSSQFLLL